MIHRNKIFTNFATSNKDYPVHSSSGLGRRPLTAETRVRSPDALLKRLLNDFDRRFFKGIRQTFTGQMIFISIAMVFFPIRMDLIPHCNGGNSPIFLWTWGIMKREQVAACAYTPIIKQKKRPLKGRFYFCYNSD